MAFVSDRSKQGSSPLKGRGWAAWTMAACLLLVGGAAARLAAGLPPELEAEQKRIEDRLSALERRAGKDERERLEQSVREIKQLLDEFAVDAELADSDPLLKRLKQRLQAAATSAGKSKSRSEMDADDAKAAADRAAKRAAAMEGVKRRGKDLLDEVVAASVDMNNVSFRKDVAPILANACVRCHNPNQKAGKVDLSTYHLFAEQIEPGKPDASHALMLVTGKAEPRMPRGGQTTFPKEWADIWAAWIRQGAKFDGPAKDAPLTQYMVDFEQQRRDALARMSQGDLLALHKKRAERHLRVINAGAKLQSRETENFLVHAIISPADADYAATLAEAVVEDLRTKFDGSAGQPIWRGKAGLYLFGDRAEYLAFAQGVDGYQPEPTEFGHLRRNPEYTYLAATNDAPGLSLDGAVAQQVAAAFLAELDGRKLPPWAAYGFSRWLAHHSFAPKDMHFRDELQRAARQAALGKGLKPLFAEAAPWTELAPAAASFFHYAMQADRKRTVAFVAQLARTGDAAGSAQAAFGASPEALTPGWAGWLAKNARR